MAYHDDLLRQAFELIHNGRGNQADLRRAVSGAYYAVFHMLISETTAHWSLASSRDALSRMFDHKVMKNASEKISDSKKLPFIGEDLQVVQGLRTVAQALVHLQEKRHIADYDNSQVWRQTEALHEVQTSEDAFRTWQSIRHEKIAQDYLVSLLIRTRD